MYTHFQYENSSVFLKIVIYKVYMNRLVVFYPFLLFLIWLQSLQLFPFFSGFIHYLPVFFILFIEKDSFFLHKWMFLNIQVKRAFYFSLLSLFLLFLTHLALSFYMQKQFSVPLQIQLFNIYFIISLCINVFFNAFAEEIIFRGYLQDEIEKMVCDFSKTTQLFLVVLIPAILFAFAHVFKMGLACFLILIPGIYFGVLKYYSKTILTSLFAHCIFNVYYYLLQDPKPF